MTEESFTVAGQSIPTITTGYGAFLALWGIVVSLLSETNSITSYAPTFAGIPLFITGILANKIPEKRKLWMHIAATFGLICALGGTRFFMVMGDGIGYASGSMLMMFLTGSIYTYFCVQSFIWARKQREAAEDVESGSATIVQNVTYNIQDSVVSGDINNTVNDD